MSDTAEHQLPTLDVANDLIDQQIVKRAFFQRMKERGHVPQTTKAATAMWNTALHLLQVPDDSPKQAEAADLYSAGAHALQGALRNDASPEQEIAVVKQAAWELAHNPQLYGAAIVIKADEAERLLQDQQGAGAAA